MPDPLDVLDVFAWNPHRGNKWATIERVLNGQLRPARPDVIALNEVRNHWPELRSWAKANGYHIQQEKPRDPNARPVPEHGSTALLVTERRVDLGILGSRTVKMRTPWKVFSHNTWHRGRRFERVRLLVGGDWTIKLTASHWPTNGFAGGNRVAFAEAATRATTVFARGRNQTVVDVGDHNESVKTLRKWARLFGGRVAGHGPDSAIVTGATVAVRRLEKWGSDHRALRYRVTRK